MLLDKYTSLGVYVIHHSFTLAELFAISGLQLVSNTLTAGIRVSLISSNFITMHTPGEGRFFWVFLHTHTDAPTDICPLLQLQQTTGEKGRNATH